MTHSSSCSLVAAGKSLFWHAATLAAKAPTVAPKSEGTYKLPKSTQPALLSLRALTVFTRNPSSMTVVAPSGTPESEPFRRVCRSPYARHTLCATSGLTSFARVCQRLPDKEASLSGFSNYLESHLDRGGNIAKANVLAVLGASSTGHLARPVQRVQTRSGPLLPIAMEPADTILPTLSYPFRGLVAPTTLAAAPQTQRCCCCGIALRTRPMLSRCTRTPQLTWIPCSSRDRASKRPSGVL